MWKHKNVTRVVLLVFSVLLVSLLFSHKTDATAGINQEMAFEGKIVLTNGTNITNGTYNMEFKIYSGGTSTGGGTLDWTEDYLVGGSGGVTMNNGTFEINLGSVNPFGASVNWNSYPLYLSLQVGNSSACTITTTFQSNCGGDGEMSPYINLTAVPYAFDALELGGVQASGFGQLANAQTWAGVQTLTSNLIANGGAAITGVTTEAYTTGVSGSAQTATVSDTNTTATAATVNGLTLSLAGTANSSGTNTNDGIYFTSIAGAPITGNTFNGLSFGTGYTNLITSANFTVAASGAVTGGAYDGLTLSSSSLAFSGASANTITGTSGQNLTLASAGAGGLTLSSGSGIISLGTGTTTLQSTATGITNINLDNAATTTLQVENSGSGVANLNLYGGSLETGTTPVIRLTNAGALTNITTIGASGAVTAGAYNGVTLSSSSLAFSGASANTITGTSGQNLTLASAGAGELLLGSGSGTIGLTSTTTTLQSTATGTTNIDLDNAANTMLQIENSGSGVADLNLYGGSLETGSTPVIRLTNAGALTNITTIGASGAVTAGAYNGVTLSSSSLAFSGASANTITGTSGQNLTLASAGAGELLLGSGSGTIGLGSSTSTIQNIASGTTNIDLDDTSNTTLQLENSGSGVADLNLYGGSLETGSTPVIRLTNAGALTNITTIGASGLATLSGGILVGSASVTNNTQDLLQLNSYDTLADTSTCSTSSNQGALYYNVVSNEVRGCINGTWQDLVSTASLALQLFGVVPNSGNNPGDLVGASATNTAGTGGPCKVNWASTTSVTVSPCLAYSDGREVSVPQTTIALTITANDYVNICLNASGTPTLMGGSATPDGTQTAANLVNTNATTLSDPILCLATIKATGTANNISVIYDTRTFTTTQKTYGTMASATEVLGGLVGPAAGGEVVATTATTGAVLGVVVATTNTAGTAGKPNIIYATQGPEWIKATGGTVNDIMNPTATSSYASGAATTGLDAYDDVGLDMSTFETSCAAATYGVTDCQASDFTNLNIH